MIYNLLAYLIAQLATISFTTNGFKKVSTKNVVVLSENGGDPNHYHDRKDYAIQIMSRAEDQPTARKQAYDVYNLINDKFGLTLPENTVKGETFPEQKTWRIIANALPGYIGDDENGLPIFSTNYIITTY